MVRKVLVAVDNLHRCETVHADLQPQNILLTNDSQLRLADFGLSRSQCADITTVLVGGTNRYMAPEVRANAAVTVKSDCFSLGVMLEEIMQGHSTLFPPGFARWRRRCLRVLAPARLADAMATEVFAQRLRNHVLQSHSAEELD
jgi:serine/threonine protein kinase